ncbi:hypothetical protein NM688_g1378 [Phlebia brevispora]|uniref:Uncharacterized protein n=1 Tax=Phlebia brevispora TaxID=194682 RepID=A0ACC1TBC0_9APHY|nr:hypothetical protein NM688_g1378 [Phlebia brevispora]
MSSSRSSSESGSSNQSAPPNGGSSGLLRDKESFQRLMAGYVPRPNAPGGPLADLVRHFSDKDPALIQQLMNEMDEKFKERGDIDTFDYTSVPTDTSGSAWWFMQLMPMGFISRKKQMMVERYEEGSLPMFQVVIYGHNTSFRAVETEPNPGLPSSATVLKALKTAIASPLPPFKAGLPSLLIITLKLQPHIDALRPFLDALPAPFRWRLETREEAEQVAEGVHEKNKRGVQAGMNIGESEKALGNQAMARKDRAAAVKHYTEAINGLFGANTEHPTEEEHKRIRNLLSICLANRAAAWLLDGEGQDVKRAARDAEDATEWNEDYAKAYYRLAKSQHLLSKKDAAVETLTKALQRPKLASDPGLNEFLIEVYGGIPEKEDELRSFCEEVFNSPNSVRGLKVFEDRANERVREVFGPQATIDSICVVRTS